MYRQNLRKKESFAKLQAIAIAASHFTILIGILVVLFLLLSRAV